MGTRTFLSGTPHGEGVLLGEAVLLYVAVKYTARGLSEQDLHERQARSMQGAGSKLGRWL